MSLPTAAELRARIESKRRTDYIASLAKTAARKAEVEATALLRLTSMIEEMSAGCSTLAITALMPATRLRLSPRKQRSSGTR